MLLKISLSVRISGRDGLTCIMVLTTHCIHAKLEPKNLWFIIIFNHNYYKFRRIYKDLSRMKMKKYLENMVLSCYTMNIFFGMYVP